MLHFLPFIRIWVHRLGISNIFASSYQTSYVDWWSPTQETFLQNEVYHLDTTEFGCIQHSNEGKNVTSLLNNELGAHMEMTKDLGV